MADKEKDGGKQEKQVTKLEGREGKWGKKYVTEKTGIITGRESSTSKSRAIELLLELNCIAGDNAIKYFLFLFIVG